MFQDLASWLHYQEISHPKSWDLGLERIDTVWKRLGASKIADYVLTIAGTNGKGSCVRWGEEICKAHGVTVASFSSPHLHDYRERIRFNGQWVQADELVAAFNRINEARGDLTLTYFEWSALACFDLMSRWRPKVALLEVGLGGRLDATNLIDANASVFTRIGLDHQDWLGETVEQIALEKGGILRPHQKAYFADKNPPEALLKQAEALHCEISRYEHNGYEYLGTPKFMHGAHQLGHFNMMVEALCEVFPVKDEALKTVLETTQNYGRLTHLEKNGQRYVFDVAHNADSAEILAEYLKSLDGKKTIVASILSDKDQRAIFQFLQPVCDQLHLFELKDNPRATPLDVLQQNAQWANIQNIHLFDDLKSAFLSAQNDWVIVMGSFITVGQALEVFHDK